jgi:two-component system, OmpR family, alkaline phosphatase synthesis response regulator PhoP
MTRAHILVAEDNEDLAFGLRTNLEYEGYRVTLVEDGIQALETARSGEPDLMVLDLMLPGMDGFRVLSSLRREGSLLPVLVLTARGEETDKVLGFRTGADDYVTKPFGVMELLARVDALLRRSRVVGNGEGSRDDPRSVRLDGPFRFGSVVVDPGPRNVTRDGEEVSLTPKEFDLLVALIRRGGIVATRKELLQEVWQYRVPVPSRTVDTHMAELRRKLEEDPSEPRHLLTVRKVGYRFQA